MESYGAFETNRELSLGQGAAVYSARKTGDPVGDAYIVKVFSLEPLVGDDQQTRSDLDPLLVELSRAFISRIELQKKAAAASSYIAPILESGRDYRGVWYATRLYPRSLQKIIAGRVALSKDGLFYIVQAILRGARDLKRTCGRSHGNLKPANVLISGAGKLKEAEIVLTDLLPGDQTEAARYETADLRAIGELIYQLVRRREINNSAGWLILPIESSKEWTELFGRDTAAWLAVCNRLLDPNLATADYTLEKLEADLAPLAPRPPVSHRTLVVAAGVAALAAAGIILFLMLGNQAMVRLTSDPSGAAISLSGQPRGVTPLQLKLKKGTYEVEAQYGNLEKRTATLIIDSGKAQSKFFEFEYGNVLVNSDPPGASVRAGDRVVGQTPFATNYVKPGTLLEFQLDLAEHDTASLKTTVKSGKTPAVLSTSLAKRGIDDELVEFDSNLPREEKLLLSGGPFKNFVTEIPFKKYMPPGTHAITATVRDWPAKPVSVTVRKGVENKARFDFDFGRVGLNSEPPGATVRIGNTIVGVTPTNIILLPGRKTFQFDAPGYEPASKEGEVSKTERLILEAKLAPILGFVAITSDPAPAAIFDAGGKQLVVTPSEKPIALTPNTYTLTARYEGLPEVQGKVTVEKGKTTPLHFPFRYGRIQLSSDPPRAEALDPLKNHWVPLEAILILPEGPRKLTARHTSLGLSDETDDIVVAVGKPQSHTFNFKYGTVNVTSLPPAAVVLENGAPIGRTPIRDRIVKFGKVTYSLSMSNRTVTSAADIFSRTNLTLGANFLKPLIETWTNSIGMTFVLVPKAEAGEGGYWVGMYEVTQEQYEQVVGKEANPSKFKAPLQPVESLSWNDATEFCKRLQATEKLKLPDGGGRYALPTEKQWSYFVGDAKLEDSVTSMSGRRSKPEPVGSTGKANQFGLFDVRGNVWEWCTSTNKPNEAVTRGGAFDGLSDKPPFRTLAIDKRSPNDLATPIANTGFRVVLIPP